MSCNPPAFSHSDTLLFLLTCHTASICAFPSGRPPCCGIFSFPVPFPSSCSPYSLPFLWVVAQCIALNDLSPPFLIPTCLHVAGVHLLRTAPHAPFPYRCAARPPTQGCTELGRTALNHVGDKGLFVGLDINFCLSLHS